MSDVMRSSNCSFSVSALAQQHDCRLFLMTGKKEVRMKFAMTCFGAYIGIQ